MVESAASGLGDDSQHSDAARLSCDFLPEEDDDGPPPWPAGKFSVVKGDTCILDLGTGSSSCISGDPAHGFDLDLELLDNDAHEEFDEDDDDIKAAWQEQDGLWDDLVGYVERTPAIIPGPIFSLHKFFLFFCGSRQQPQKNLNFSFDFFFGREAK